MEHRSKCEKETIPCPYKDIGCKEKMLRERLEQLKEEKCLAHLDDSMENIMQLQEVVGKQTKMIKDITQKSTRHYCKPFL